MNKINLKSIKKIHFIGIGGIGVSALARMFLVQGVAVSGSDTAPSDITDALEKHGAVIFTGHAAENIDKDIDIVVYTVAIDPRNPEFIQAQEYDIETRTYSQMLGIISEGHYTVAISGTHGKTTTTAMIAKVTVDTGLDPTVIVGSLLKDSGSNLVVGKSSLFIVEACEYKRSFLDLTPNILVITNIDADHLDYYKNLADIQSAFAELAQRLGPNDFIVCNPNDENINPVIKNIRATVIDYSLGCPTPKLPLKVTGDHNQKNALAALAVSEILKVEEEKALHALSEFPGVWRRFEYKGETKEGAQVYDDYAHHPTEIRATLCAARKQFPHQKITVIFQPHLYSRTKFLLNDLAKSFTETDELVLAPIYAAREKEDLSISSRILAEEVKKNNTKIHTFDNFNEIEQFITDNMKKDDIIVTMGAGDVFKIGDSILQTDM